MWNFEEVFFSSVAISADGQYITAGGICSYAVYLFNKTSASPLWAYNTAGHVWTVDISADGEYIVAGDQHHRVYLFDKDRRYSNSLDLTMIMLFSLIAPQGLQIDPIILLIIGIIVAVVVINLIYFLKFRD